jgi:peptide/nickel transport system ATP-binding protein
MTRDPLLSLEDVTVHFERERGLFDRLLSDSEVVRAVDGVSVDLAEQDVLALVGESGCGKTTLGKTAVGLQRPTGGSVKYRGQDIWEAKRRRGDPDVPFDQIRRSLQIIHQDPGSSLNPNRSVFAILSSPLKHWHSEMDYDDRERRILSMLNYVGMQPAEDYAQRYPHQLSGGEKQRVALVKALLMEPDVILADEAVSALDVSLRVEMMDLLIDLQEKFNTSYIFVSHNLSNARYMTEHTDGKIGVMYLGELVEIGSPQEIINDPKHPYTQILRWSTVEDLDPDQESRDPPVRSIDIPDPIDPPSGCRFHTRCPEAREACRRQNPTLSEGADSDHPVACFRKFPEGEHDYWQSDPLPGTEDIGAQLVEE